MLPALDDVLKQEGGSNFRSDLLLLNLMNRSIYSYITALEVGLCVHKKLLCLVIHIYRYFNVGTMASSAIMLFPFSANNDGDILLHS